MARSFSEQEKKNIRKNIVEACRHSWTQYGYKKTSVDELCRQTGISKGAFYLFFASKESLFCEVLCSEQEQIYAAASKIMEEKKGKEGVAEALKLIYRAYDKNNFLYNANSADYTVLMNKLSNEQVAEIEKSNNMSRELFLNHPYLKLKVEEDIAISVIYSLIMMIKNKEIIPNKHTEIFEFMVDHLIDDLYVE
ncbi:MAG: TetR/AcrR family transcriptional regulator [Hespellia sp.]|nr:TetR/AcrR family transcriptional regulator [Hespellia sp.]